MSRTGTAAGNLGWRTAKKPPAAPVVWDIGVRLFHWALVASVGTAAATGFLAAEWWLDVHLYAGYAVALLIVFRLVWAFYGSFYARFSNFLFSARDTWAHIRAVAKGRPKPFTGHNPAGALMVFSLLFILGALTVSGILVLGGQENQGVLAGIADFGLGSAARGIHELLAIVLLFMIAAHILGVAAESYLSRENLVLAMVTGRKLRPSAERPPSLEPASPGAALVAIALLFAVGGGASWALLSQPPSGLVAMPPNAAYSTECGDCHHAYHPSLLPASSWRSMMAGLANHFGEDASLDKQTTADITAYVTAHAAERWDTEAANNLRRVSKSDPFRITASPYWTARHKDIAREVFTRKKVGSKGNCIACHGDASSGRFDDQMIAVPGN